MGYSVGETNPRFEQQERHSREDALTDKEYELLYEAAQSLPDDYYSLQSQFYHAGRGLGVLPLQALMGWCDLQTPMKYVKSSGKNTSRELRSVHNR